MKKKEKKKNSKNQNKKEHKKRFEQIPLPKTIWLSLFFILIFMILLATVSANMAYQEPTETIQTYTTLRYNGNSRYSYTANLVNNTVYEKTQLRPGEGIIFKQLVTNITGSHQYTFEINQPATINITQSIQAIVKTDLWTKSYPLVPLNSTVTIGTKNQILATFPINYQFYDEIIKTINEETGMNAPNPVLIFRSSISVTAKLSNNNTIYEYLQPELTMSLSQKTIEFSDVLTQQHADRQTDSKIINHPEVFELRENRLYTLIFMIVVFGFYGVFTKMEPTRISAEEKELNRIQKKYGEWIVQSHNSPFDTTSKKITLNSMKELSRLSEELGKPMIHYVKRNKKNVFLVIDNNHIYQYPLSVSDEFDYGLISKFNSTITSFLNKTNDILSSSNKPIPSEAQKTIHMTKTVKCKHCKSSFTIQEETKNKTKGIITPCPHCGFVQYITLKQPWSILQKIKHVILDRKKVTSTN